MFSFRSLGLGVPSFISNFTSSNPAGSSIDIPSVPIHDIDSERQDRGVPARRLDQFLRSNHLNHSIIYHNLTFHNHLPHILGSSYLLGADAAKLGEIYDEESKSLEPWHDSPGEISKDDWRDFMGKREYQRAFVDFFDDRRVELGYSWKDLLNKYLFEGKHPLVYNLFCSLAHPVIHLAYAYELSHEFVAIEALAMESCFYDEQYKYFEDPSYTKPAPNPSADLLEILSRVAQDTRLEQEESISTENDVTILFKDPAKEALVLEYWNSWDLAEPKKQFQDSQKVATALLVATADGGEDKYNFYVCHVLTSSHAARVLLPLFQSKWHMTIARQWWMFALAAYIMEHRPKIDLVRIIDFELEGRDWNYVVDRAVSSEWSTDAHFVKACRAMKVCAETWGDEDQFYLKAAVRFASRFSGWGF